MSEGVAEAGAGEVDPGPRPGPEPEAGPAAADRRGVLVALLLAVGLTVSWYLLFGHVNVNSGDEGYLWYGVQRTAAGEVPLRDFQAYDPGRYYWCAAWGELFGTGILGVRKGAAILQAIGLFCGLLVARRVVRHPAWLLPIGVTLLVWMFPRHKVFESAVSMMAVYVGVRLLERPTVRMHFLTGVFVGLAGVIGRNHSTYAFLGTFCLLLLLAFRTGFRGTPRRFLAWGGGVVVGYSPILFMLLFVPGFAEGFFESIRVLARLGMNIPYPWPWPWRLEYAGLPWYDAWMNAGLAMSFLVPVVALPIGIVVGLRSGAADLRRRAALIAATALGVFYLHHASVRSDAPHFAQCMHPSLLAFLALPSALGWRPRAILGISFWVVFGVLTSFVVGTKNHMLLRHRVGGNPPPLVDFELAGEPLKMDGVLAEYLARLSNVLHRHVKDDPIFFAPSKPGYYPIYGKVSPTFGIYFFVPDATDEEQEEIIRDLGTVDWAFIVDLPVAKQEALYFRNSHPRVWAYLLEEFRRIPTPSLPPDNILLRRRDG